MEVCGGSVHESLRTKKDYIVAARATIMVEVSINMPLGSLRGLFVCRSTPYAAQARDCGEILK